MDIPANGINEILENNPSQGTLYVLLSVMKENGKYNLVIQECLKALSRYPEDLTLRKILAEAYLGDGRFVEAESEFGEVIDGMKALAGVYRSQAEIFIHQKREEDAIGILKQYIVFYPEDENALMLLEELLAKSAVTSIEVNEENIDACIPEAEGSDIGDAMEAAETDDFSEDNSSNEEIRFDDEAPGESREMYEDYAESTPDEIPVMMEKEETEPQEIENTLYRKKEKMISILDSWRSNIRKLSDGGVAASDV